VAPVGSRQVVQGRPALRWSRVVVDPAPGIRPSREFGRTFRENRNEPHAACNPYSTTAAHARDGGQEGLVTGTLSDSEGHTRSVLTHAAFAVSPGVNAGEAGLRLGGSPLVRHEHLWREALLFRRFHVSLTAAAFFASRVHDQVENLARQRELLAADHHDHPASDAD
jgi:hypothetical protein